MAQAPDYTGLVKAGMVLRMHAPEGWDQFVLEMQRYSASMAHQMVGAPIDLLQRAQGMALAAAEIAGVLRDTPTLYEKIGPKHGRGK
jgi:hypothetical protein